MVVWFCGFYDSIGSMVLWFSSFMVVWLYGSVGSMILLVLWFSGSICSICSMVPYSSIGSMVLLSRDCE